MGLGLLTTQKKFLQATNIQDTFVLSRDRLYKELRNFIPIFSCLAYLWRPHMHLDLAFVDSRYGYKSIDSVREKW